MSYEMAEERIRRKREGIAREIMEKLAPEFALLTPGQATATTLILLKQISMQLDLIISELPDLIGE